MRLEYFQMIDSVSRLDVDGGEIEALAEVPDESTIFEGHFPGRPLLPGVLMIETMAQASGFLVLARERMRNMPFLASVANAKMRTFVEPGTTLDVSAKIEHPGSGFIVTKAYIKSAGAKVCDAQLTFRVMPFPSDELQGHMQARFDEIYPAGLPV